MSINFYDLSFLKKSIYLITFFLLSYAAAQAQYDLALTKVVDRDSVGIGETVTYTITVMNEGANPVTDVIVGFSASGSTLVSTDAPNATGADSYASEVWHIDNIAAGGTANLSMMRTIDAEGVAYCLAEISEFRDVGGTIAIDSDSAPNNMILSEDDIASACVSVPIGICPALNDDLTVSVPISGLADLQWFRDTGNGPVFFSADNQITITEYGQYTYTSDLDGCGAQACCPIIVEERCLDLALHKMVSAGQASTVMPGDTVSFDITVVNQGDVSIDTISIVDYIPTNMSYVAQMGWTDNGSTASMTIDESMGLFPGADALDTGETVTFTILLAVNGNVATGTVVTNWAEISAHTNTTDVPLLDVDSTPDMDNTDKFLVDNDINGSGELGGDEDDHDPAEVVIAPFDLALNKTLADGQSANVAAGDTVNYTITVANQGAITADDIDVTDYIPTGMTLVGTDWTSVSSSEAMITLSIANGGLPATGLLPGAMVTVDISLEIDAAIANETTFVNFAEISHAHDLNGNDLTDIDSTPDNNPDNDTYLTNDDMDGDGMNGGDEDDHDPEEVSINNGFDLALIKLTSATNVTLGDTILFTILVKNQGTVNATNVDVIDYIPAGFAFPSSDIRNMAWTPSSNVAAAVETTIMDLDADAEETLQIWLEVVNEDPTTWVNAAEIIDAENDNGDHPQDADSTPDTDNGDDLVDREDINDNDVYDDEADDEDDHDIAIPTPGEFDLALIKLTEAKNVSVGDTVLFTIQVMNQGTIDAMNVTVMDYVPTGLSFVNDATLNPGWFPNATGQVETDIDDLNATIDTTLNIWLEIINEDPATWVNAAEITSAENDNGDEPTDADSTPDTDNGDPLVDREDAGDNNIYDDEADDEDDHDIAYPTPGEFDLALIKLTSATNVSLGDTIPFTIHVMNQGTIDAQNVAVIDYIPAGLAFPIGDARNTAWMAGVIASTAEATIADLNAGEEEILTIWLEVTSQDPAAWVNAAEITTAQNDSGNTPTDVDSTPDTDNGDPLVDRENATDNTTYDDEADDEDDHDIAIPSAGSFDLALTKLTLESTVSIGDDVEFTVSVANQGTIDAQNVSVIDYIPEGFDFNAAANTSSGWTVVGSNATHLIADLDAGVDTVLTIVLTVNNSVLADAGGDLINAAEISAAFNDAGEQPVDEDSTPDTENGDDLIDRTGKDDHITIDDSADDEDDHDIAVVSVEVVDLAIRKTTTQMAAIQDGDNVVWTITVFNQGTVTAQNIQVVDYLPTSFTLSPDDTNGWMPGATTASVVNTVAGPIPPNGSATIQIITKADSPITPGQYENTVEIYGSEDLAGNDTTNDDIDSSADDTFGNDTQINDEIFGDALGNPGEDEDDEDVAYVNVNVFDLALRKTLTSNDPVQWGDDVEFTITVFNQGAIAATDIAVTDYIPAGFALSANDFNGWSYAGGQDVVSNIINNTIQPGDSFAMSIVLTVQAGASMNDLENNAEITAAEDNTGTVQDDNDIDSTPDDTLGNDNEQDDVITDNGDMDEDDHDFAEPPVFDLALRKTTLQTTPVTAGDDVLFTIEVFNQGTLAADSIEVVDYIPAGLTLSANDMNGWTAVGDNAMTTLTGTLAPGASTTVDILLTVGNTVEGVVYNFAEIASAEDDQDNDVTDSDFDSTPDTDNTNDVNVDDEINDNGIVGTDEDDHDGAPIDVFQTFDLALTKTLEATQSTTVEPGDDVTFTITVFNQGTQDAYDVDIVDYIPNDMTLNDTDWTASAEGAMATIDFIEADGQATIDITLTVSADFMGTSITNYAEVADGTNTDGGMTSTDEDSTPDTDGGNDVFGMDDEINEDGLNGGDEDDHDPASVDVQQTFDLALAKTLATGQVTEVNPGDDVTFTITVTNQGTLDAYDVEVTDYVPAEMSLNDGAWTADFSYAVDTIEFLAAGESMELDITLMVNSTFQGDTITNWAEISHAHDVAGNDPSDVDSTPDNNPTNDTYTTNDGIDGDGMNGGDEDDHDPEGIGVNQTFDLALNKALAASQITPIQPGDELTFTVTVYNQGSLDAYEVEVVDYIPTGLTLADIDWDLELGNAVTTIDEVLAGSSATVDITFRVNADFMGDSIANFAEIFDAEDVDGNNPTDEDSTPDTDNTNDTVDNDVIDEDGMNGGDEDDHDIEEVPIEQTFDLALAKTLAAGQASSVMPGADVTFTVTVTNQGTLDAYDVDIVDYIPTGLTLNDADWTAAGNNATYTVDYVAAGTFETVDITLTVAADFMGAAITNFAEITDATDTDGGTTTPDMDSTPDTDDTNDTYTTNDDIDGDGMNGGDEDDHDPETIDIDQVFDLALAKTLAAGQATSVAPGDDVTFTITVTNQGSLDAYDVDIADYVPAEMSLNDGTWAAAGQNAIYTIDFVAAGESVEVDITLMVNTTFTGDAITNWAEITDATDTDGGTTTPDTDSTPDDNSGNDTYTTNDDIDGDGMNGGDEDDHDPETIDVDQPFDLAINKALATGQSSSVTPGENVTFTITVYNQGGQDAHEVEIIDYIPEGLTIADSDWTAEGDDVIYEFPLPIKPGTSASVDITFTVDTDFMGTSIVNATEITHAHDEDGNDPTDEDSTPDTDNTNDIVVDNETEDDGTTDEDDHDIEVIDVEQTFDLALAKTIKDGAGMTYAPGSNVVFTITVTNQGTLDAYDVDIIDYIPAGLELNDSNWTMDGNNATTTVDFVAANSTASVDITFMIDADFMGGSITNFAEITDATDTDGGTTTPDMDSTPDSDDDNDTYTTNDDIDGDGMNGGDEDDHDPETIDIEQTFDLALIKRLAQGQATSVSPGDDVTFTITVINQGSLDAYDIDIVDYVPVEMSLNDGDWTASGSNTTYTVDFLEAGGTIDIDITLMVNTTFAGESLTNWAEITDATDTDGGTTTPDTDSTPDSNDNNDTYTTNDEVDEDGMNGGDEDDHDAESIDVNQPFDLALSKTLGAGQASSVMLGEDITFTINVINQGGTDAYDIDLIDYIPTGLTLNDSDWTMAGSNATFTIDFLEAGSAVGIDVTFTVDASFTGTSIVNTAEITDATDTDGGTTAPDVDSTPDDNDSNDPTIDNEVDDDGTNDEDDHDTETFDVDQPFDLALIKQLADGQTTTVAPGDEVTFTITVINQGGLDAYDIDIVDYVPVEMSLNDGDWTSAGTNATYTVDFLEVGASIDVDITLMVNTTFAGESLTNWAEITDATDTDGGTTTPDVDSTPDSNDNNDTYTTNDEVDEDGMNGGDEDDHDAESIDVDQPDFDLALIKQLANGQATTVAPGDEVTFTITVINQGGVDAYDIDIVDYVPVEMSLNDGDWTSAGTNATYTVDFLEVGASIDIDITLMVNTTFMGGALINWAEVADASDEDGGTTTPDIDSTPDSDNDNDTYTTNDDVDGDGMNGGDEDDHDQEVIDVNQTFDLALDKSLSATQVTPIALGDEVTFTITVTNEGTLDAYEVELADYIPTGLTLNDTAWEIDGGNAVYTIDEVAAGTSVGVDITFTVDASFMGTSITNAAEITNAEDEYGTTPPDIDSTPNTFPPLGDGSDDDEDDSDTETFDVCPEVVASDSVEICQGEETQLTAAMLGDDVTYSWAPPLGLSCADCANPVASPNTSTNYQVTATRGNCISTAVVTVTVNAAIAVTDEVDDADCCDLGSIDLTIAGGSGDFTYTWEPAVSTTNTATQLDAGTYAVTIQDEKGCSIIRNYTINDNCMDCPEYIAEDTIYVNLGEEVAICATIPFLDRDVYDVILDGSTYTPPMVVCDIDTVIFYTYALTVNQGQSGPYHVDSWVCANGVVHSATVEDMNELARLMDEWDPAGNWMHNPETFTISGGSTSVGYMNIEITHVPTQVHATIMTNYTGIARGTEITYTADEVGEHTLEVEGPDCCDDTVIIIVIDPCADYTASAGDDQTICSGEFTELNATGGTSYVWTPAASLSGADTATPIARPNTTTTYTVVVTNAIGCTATDQVTVTVSETIQLNIDELVAADCCDGGSVAINVTGGTGDLTYTWSDDSNNTTSASSLPVGDYGVTVTDELGCSASVGFTIADECGDCPEFFEEDEITAPAGEEVSVCVPALLSNSDIYEVILDGSDYVGPMTPCDVDSVIFYTYALTVNQGQSGPYRLDFWQCNTVTIEDIVVQDMNELTAVLNTNDPLGNWVHNPDTYTISGGADVNNNTYGDILITHIPTTVQAVIQTNFTGLAQGSELTITGEPGEHELVVINTAECCYDTLTIIFEVVCDLSVSADVVDADCCGDNGSVTFNVTGGNGDLTYTWTDGISDSNTATGLSEGAYKVTITDEYGCTQVGQINVGSDCNDCEDIFTTDVVTFTEGQDANVCVPIPFAERNIYDVILDGSGYNQPTTPCNVDSVIFYTYALTVNQGQSGPYRLDFWQCNDVVIQNEVVADMDELTALMNAHDPDGNWTNNASTFTISGGADGEEYVYGDILITHMPTTVQATIQTNYTGVAFGFQVDVPDAPGTYEVEIVNTEDCCTDIITVIVTPGVIPPTMTEETVYVTTAYGTTAEDVCNLWTSALTGDVTVTVCDQPNNGALANATSCADYTPNAGFAGQDEFCILITDANGNTETYTVIVTVLEEVVIPTMTEETVYVTTAYGTTAEDVCNLWTSALTGDVTVTVCDQPNNGALANATSCADYTPNAGFAGQDEFCILITDANGNTETYTVIVTVLEEVVIPTMTEETVYVTTAYGTTAEDVCNLWTSALTGDVTVTVCDQPNNGSLANATSCADYTPNAGFAGQDEFCILITDANGNTETYTVIVTVLEEVVIPTMTEETVYVTTPYGTTAEDVCNLWTSALTGDVTVTVCDQPNNGALANATSCADYTPNAGFAGQDEFCILITDANGNTETYTVIVTVLEEVVPVDPGNDTIYFMTPYETPLTNQCMPVNKFFEDGVAVLSLCDAPDNGTVTNIDDFDTCLNYVPNDGFSGVDEFCVEACNEEGVCGTFIIFVTVGEPAAPMVNDTIYLTTPYETTLTNICVPISDVFTSGFESLMITDMPNNGFLSNVADGDQCVNYTPNDGFTAIDEFGVVVCNNEGICGTFTIFVDVQDPIVQPPVNNGLDSVYYTTPYETPLTSQCMPWDKFFDDGFESITLCDPTAENGTVILNAADECLDYIPNAGFSGIDDFCVTVCNDQGVCGTLTVFVTVGTPGIVLTPDTIEETTNINTAIEICVDTEELPNTAVLFASCEDPANGTIAMTSSTTECFTYVPNTDFVGDDSFCVYICNEAGICDTTYVTVHVIDTDCPDLIDSTPINVASCDAAGLAGVCLPLTLEEIVGLTITDNGAAYTGGFSGCDLDTLITYSIVPIPSQGQSGPYTILSWTENGDLHENVTFETIDDLVNLMNTWDPTGNWVLDAQTSTIAGGIATGEYSSILVKQDLTNATGNLDPNVSFAPNAAQVSLTEGVHTLTFTDANGCTDELVVTVDCGVTTTTLDTVFIDITVDMIDDLCPTNLGITGTVVSIDNECAEDSGENVIFGIDESTNCLTYQGVEIGTDTACVVICTETEGCFEVIVVVSVQPELECDKIVDGEDQFMLQTANCDIPVPVCVDLSFSDSGTIDLNVNDIPYTGAYTSCDGGYGTEISLLPGAYQLEFVDVTNGCRDTVDVTVACITPMTITDTIYVNATDTTCIDLTELPGSVVSITDTCPENNGEFVIFELQPESYCVTYDGMEVGDESACIVVCDDLGFCDTTYIFVTVEAREAIPSVVMDVDTTLENTPIDIDVLANDTLSSVSNIFIASQPEHGAAMVTDNGIVTYAPEENFCDMQNGDSFTYTVCDDQGNCETAQVVVYVICDELQIYTGFSPNGDGVNDVFYIEGLEAYPNAQLTVFNRWGNQVYRSDNYKNDWNGMWEGKLLPDGTYFYVLDDGEGNLHSGYVQIHR